MQPSSMHHCHLIHEEQRRCPFGNRSPRRRATASVVFTQCSSGGVHGCGPNNILRSSPLVQHHSHPVSYAVVAASTRHPPPAISMIFLQSRLSCPLAPLPCCQCVQLCVRRAEQKQTVSTKTYPFFLAPLLYISPTAAIDLFNREKLEELSIKREHASI